MDATVKPGDWFVEPALWSDMERWHREVGEIRRTTPVLPVDRKGFERFWVLTRHEDVYAQAYFVSGVKHLPVEYRFK